MKVLGRIVLPMLCAVGLPAQVSYQDLLNAEATPENWLTYSGTYKSQHYSGLKQITRENVGDLEFKWAFHGSPKGKLQTTPLVVDGVMYLTEGNNDVTALDAKTGRRFWTCSHTLPKKVHVVALTNRGAALLDDRVFTGTLDGRLIALDAKTGHVLWDKKVCDYTKGYAVTMAPLAVKDKVIVGTAGGEFGIRGYIDAYDAATGERAWRFYTIPGPGEPGHESWENDAWKTGGGSAWVTGSFDPELNLTYWGIGNPSPDWNGDVRPGDNLYSGSVVALDADTGKLKWHFQFTPPRHLGLGRGSDPRARGQRVSRPAAQVDALGQPQRVLLCSRPRERRIPFGKTIHQANLGRETRRKRPADQAAGDGTNERRHESLPSRPGSHQLVCAFLQSKDRAFLLAGVGGLLGHVLLRGTGLHSRQPLRWQPDPTNGSHKDTARRHRLRGHPRTRSRNGGAEVGVQDDRDLRIRPADHGRRPALLRQL